MPLPHYRRFQPDGSDAMVKVSRIISGEPCSYPNGPRVVKQVDFSTFRDLSYGNNQRVAPMEHH